MTREELEHIHTTTLHMAETPQRATLKSYVFRLVEALEAALKEIAALSAKVQELQDRAEDDWYRKTTGDY